MFSSGTRANDDWGIWISITYQTDFGGSKYLAFLELALRFKHDSGDFQQFKLQPQKLDL
jgi:hypothetical protein